MSPAKQANRAGRPWQRKDGRWAARAYPPDGSKPRMVYGATEAEVTDRQHEVEAVENQLEDLPLIHRPETPKAHHDAHLPPQPAPEIRQRLTDLPPRPEKPIRVTVDLTPDEHMRLRLYAARHRISGAQVVREALGTYLDISAGHEGSGP